MIKNKQFLTKKRPKKNLGLMEYGSVNSYLLTADSKSIAIKYCKSLIIVQLPVLNAY